MSAGPALSPAPLEHCATCTCDHSSPRAVEYAKRVEVIKTPLAFKQLSMVMAEAAAADLLAWFGWARRQDGRSRPKRVWVLAAHEQEIVVQVRETTVKTYRRKLPNHQAAQKNP